MKPTIPILILAAASGLAAEPSRFDLAVQRASIESRIDAFPDNPALFNRPAPQLPVEPTSEIKRRLRLEILGPFADIAPHPATEFGFRLRVIAREEAAHGFTAIRPSYEATLHDLRAFLDTNSPR